MMYILIRLILPSRGKTSSKYSSPINHLPHKETPQDINEVKIEQILSMQDGIEKNSIFVEDLQRKLSFVIMEISFVALICIIYSCFLFHQNFLL